MPDYTLDHSIPYPSPDDEVRGDTDDYLQTDLRDLAVGADAAITTAVATRAPLVHTHTIQAVTGLQAELDAIAQPDVVAVAEGIYATTQASEVATGIHDSTVLHEHQSTGGISRTDLDAAMAAYTDVMEGQ